MWHVAVLATAEGGDTQPLTDDEPGLACLGVLLSHGRLSAENRSWALTFRGTRLHVCDRHEEALTEFDRAIAHNDPTSAWALASRGEAHRQTGRYDEAIKTSESVRPASQLTQLVRSFSRHGPSGDYGCRTSCWSRRVPSTSR